MFNIRRSESGFIVLYNLYTVVSREYSLLDACEVQSTGEIYGLEAAQEFSNIIQTNRINLSKLHYPAPIDSIIQVEL